MSIHPLRNPGTLLPMHAIMVITTHVCNRSSRNVTRFTEGETSWLTEPAGEASPMAFTLMHVQDLYLL